MTLLVREFDTVTITRFGVQINDHQYRYDDRLEDALDEVIARVQTRTRNARDDVRELRCAGPIRRLAWFLDDLADGIPFEPRYREAIERADALVTVGMIIEQRGVVRGGALAHYAGHEKLTHEQVYRVRFGSDPPTI